MQRASPQPTQTNEPLSEQIKDEIQKLPKMNQAMIWELLLKDSAFNPQKVNLLKQTLRNQSKKAFVVMTGVYLFMAVFRRSLMKTRWFPLIRRRSIIHTFLMWGIFPLGLVNIIYTILPKRNLLRVMEDSGYERMVSRTRLYQQYYKEIKKTENETPEEIWKIQSKHIWKSDK